MSSLAGFHYHFYQPPREDPWTGVFHHEWSAWPYHDWNERIATECYRAMVAVTLPGESGEPTIEAPLAESIFDLGPTLHRWLAVSAPDVDVAVRRQVAGHAADLVMAAPLVHAIIPLATPEDQRRLVRWGIDDFRSRYGETPRSMWLPETGVDLDSLEVLAAEGIEFTVLMPTQAARVRALDGEWREVDAASLDTSRPYLVRLPSGASLSVVFGHRQLSHDVAFAETLADGGRLADLMAGALPTDRDGAVLIVADGETYGHHHRFGDLGAAWATRRLREHYALATALGPWLDSHPAADEVELHEVSAWSCAHGVGRWREDCGCVTGETPGYSLAWRAPLRAALDWLRENAGAALDWELGHHVRVSGEALDDYGKVLSGEWSPRDFVARHQSHDLSEDETSRVLEVCEAHRNLLFAFTSCAWFFADPGEIETGIVLRYADLALELTRRTTGREFTGGFVERLDAVASARHHVAGEALWRRAVEASRTDEVRVAAGAGAEWALHGGFARTSRGDWDIDFADEGEDVVRVQLAHRLTLRRSSFLVTTTLGEGLDAHVDISDNTMWRRVALSELGDEVVARIALARLVGPGSADVDSALAVLAADLLSRDAGPGDELALVALAVTPRFVSPLAEASIRRALAAISARDQGVVRPALADLALAVGVADTFNLPGPPGANH